jgi:hypothetical protein
MNPMTPVRSAHKRTSVCMKPVCLFNPCIGRHLQLVNWVPTPASTAISSFILAQQGTILNYPIAIAAGIRGTCVSSLGIDSVCVNVPESRNNIRWLRQFVMLGISYREVRAELWMFWLEQRAKKSRRNTVY